MKSHTFAWQYLPYQVSNEGQASSNAARMHCPEAVSRCSSLAMRLGSPPSLVLLDPPNTLPCGVFCAGHPAKLADAGKDGFLSPNTAPSTVSQPLPPPDMQVSVSSDCPGQRRYCLLLSYHLSGPSIGSGDPTQAAFWSQQDSEQPLVLCVCRAGRAVSGVYLDGVMGLRFL